MRRKLIFCTGAFFAKLVLLIFIWDCANYRRVTTLAVIRWLDARCSGAVWARAGMADQLGTWDSRATR